MSTSGYNCIIPHGYQPLKELQAISIILPPVEELVFLVSFATVFGVVRQPFEQTDGDIVPVVIFKKKPAYFHALLIALNFAFTGAVTTMSFRDKSPKMASYCRRVAVVSAMIAAGVFATSVFFYSFML